MSGLVLSPNLNEVDDFYSALLSVHDGLDAPDVHALNARLILILANHIGRTDVLLEALEAARIAASCAPASPE